MNPQTYRSFFGFTKETFDSDLRTEEILVSPALQGVKDRLEYTLRLGALAVVTGEVGKAADYSVRAFREQ